MFSRLDKLFARAIKCVFLRYSRLQKRYWCYTPKTKKYYMVANVTFFEQTYYLYASIQDVHVIQHVILIPMVELNISNVSVNPSLDQNPRKPSSPHIDILRHKTLMDSPVIQEHGESPSLDSSPSSLNTMNFGKGDLRWPIALRKGTCSTWNTYPIYNFLSYHRLLHSYFFLLSLVSFITTQNLQNKCKLLAHYFMINRVKKKYISITISKYIYNTWKKKWKNTFRCNHKVFQNKLTIINTIFQKMIYIVTKLTTMLGF